MKDRLNAFANLQPPDLKKSSEGSNLGSETVRSARRNPKPPRRRGLVLPIIAVLALGLAIFSVWRLRPVRTEQPPPYAPPGASLAYPAANLDTVVAGVGLVEANTENIELSLPVPGWVTAVYVHAGDQVKAGDKLFSLDDRDLRAQLEVRKAQLAQASAGVESARAGLADAELLDREAQRLNKGAVLSKEEVDRKHLAAVKANADLAQAEAQVALYEAQIHETEVDIERRTVTAPVAGEILQSKVRVGQYAPTGALDPPLMNIGNTEPLNIRVDIDENDAWRVMPGNKARAFVRGNSNEQVNLKFLRFEPYVLPKQSLTGSSNERVDTRVLQAIYQVESNNVRLFVGQQMDVFINGQSLRLATGEGETHHR
jgi:RND family efflux transporter MFP subunit